MYMCVCIYIYMYMYICIRLHSCIIFYVILVSEDLSIVSSFNM
jgi:hypothetical protein